MALQASDLRPEASLSSGSTLGSGSESDESRGAPVTSANAGPAHYKKGQNSAQVNDSWNRSRARLETRVCKVLARFPAERFEAAFRITQQQAREQQQQQQSTAELAPAQAEAGPSLDLQAADIHESNPQEADSDQPSWNQPMAMLIMQGPNGKQSLFRSDALAEESSTIAHRAAMLACSALENVAQQQRLASDMEACDLPEPRIAHLAIAGNAGRKKRRLPQSKQVRAKARKVFQDRVVPQLTEAHSSWLRGPHSQQWQSCHYAQHLDDCPAGAGCYSIRETLVWPAALPLADPSRVAFNTKQHELLLEWGRSQGHSAEGEQEHEAAG